MKKQLIVAMTLMTLVLIPQITEAAEAAEPQIQPVPVGEAEVKQPYKVALFDILDTTGWVDRNLQKNLAKRLADELHVPLNGYLQKIKVFTPAETMAVYRALPEDIRNSRDSTVWLKASADKLETDLVLCLSIDGAYERTWINWEGDMCYEGYAQVTLRGWDRKAGKPVNRSANRWERDDCSTLNGLDALIYNLTEEILAKEKLRDRFFPTK